MMNEKVKELKIRNLSGLKPLGRSVLVQPYEPEIKAAASRIVIPQAAKERNSMIEARATVIEIGPVAWDDESEPRCKVGDRVLIAKFAGAMATGTLDGKLYRLVNDRDIYCKIGEEE